MDIPDDYELEGEFGNIPQFEDYFFDEDRFQQQVREDQSQEEEEREERRKRAKWLNNYYEFKGIQRRRRAQTNTLINLSTNSQTSAPLLPEYERELQAKKDAWANQFIHQPTKSTQFIREYHGVQVVFPKDPYPQQEKYVRRCVECLIAGENCFIESPTGTGKTFCNLIASLGFIFWKKRTQSKHIKVIYLSRTHSQLQQVVKELQQTCYRPTMTIMSSREHSCINEKVNTGQFNGRDLIDKCNESRSAYFKLKKMNKDAPYQQEEIDQLCSTMCPHFKERYQTVKKCEDYHNEVMQLQDFKEKGKGCFCPYFYPLYMEDHCDLFLMPYNYLLDARLFKRYEDLIHNSILIFDEAHNVADACCEGRSFQAKFSMLDGFCKEIQALQSKDPKYAADKKVVESIRTKQMMDKLALILREVWSLKETILAYLDSIPFHRAQEPQIKNLWPKLFYQADQRELKWSYVVSSSNVEQTLVELVLGLSDAQLQLYRQSWPHRLQYNDRTIRKLLFIIEQKDQICEAFKGIKGYSFFNINQTSKFLDRIVQLFETHKNCSELLSVYHDQLKHYCLVFKVQLGSTVFESNGFRNIADYCLSLNCLVPWFTFKEIQSCKPYSIFFTSGTMKPIKEWKHELNIRGEEFVNKHVIKDCQILLNIISHNQDQEIFNFSYDYMDPRRNNILKRYQQMLKMIVALLRQIPGGVLVIFPNYKYVENTRNYLDSALCRFRQQIKKRVYFEQRGSLQQINQYKDHTKNGGEGVLFGVCRGKASEGVDFPDQQCRAVIFVGIPYQNAHTPQLMEKKIHYKKHEGSQTIPELKQISWGAYYFNSTIRAINQGLGRVIRHKYDYGQLFLLDCRFLERQKWNVKRRGWTYVHFRDYLPSWATNKWIEWGDDPEEIRRRLSELRTFYQYNRVHIVRPN